MKFSRSLPPWIVSLPHGLAGLLTFVCLSGAWATHASGQVNGASEARRQPLNTQRSGGERSQVRDDQSPAAKRYLGFNACLKCHAVEVGQEVLDPAGNPIEIAGSDWILCGEFQVWSGKDKHGEAFQVLYGERSRKMGQLMGVEVHRDARCLACHTGYPVEDVCRDADGLCKIDKTNVGMQFGVGCEGCHGPSADESKAGGWFNAHQQSDRWRYLSAAEKESHGYVDVRSPAARTRMCLSCHLGSVEDGRIVTHEMYAVGHPPLPGVEIETFLQQMPRHWRYLHEKKPSLRTEFVRRTNDAACKSVFAEFAEDQVSEGRDPPRTLPRTRSLAVGALVTLSESLRLSADLADSKCQVRERLGIPKPAWPDLSSFDCYACHHDLQYPGWRQARRERRAPGRPNLPSWPRILASAVFDVVDSAAAPEFQQRLGRIDAAVFDQPFGNREALVRECRATAQSLDQFAAQLEGLPMPRTTGKALGTRIAQLGAAGQHDFDTIRQLAWALLLIDSELHSGLATVKEINDSQKSALGELVLSRRNNSTLRSALESMRDPLQLNLRADAGGAYPSQINLSRVLPSIANHDPQSMQAVFADVVEQLGPAHQ